MSSTDSLSGRAARHVALAQVGAKGQQAIAASTALIIGVGGIGCAAASYLTSSGIGQLLLCDFDTVDATNLGRQILYGPADVGELKAERAASALRKLNPDVRLTAVTDRMDDRILADAVVMADIVLDGSDNFATRFQVNEACVAARRCLISGAAIRLEAQLAVFGPDFGTSPCYRCLYTEADESLENCAGNGVLASVPGMVGTMMATEALKTLTGNASDVGRLTLYEGLSGEWRQVSIKKRVDCPVCA